MRCDEQSEMYEHFKWCCRGNIVGNSRKQYGACCDCSLKPDAPKPTFSTWK